QHYGAGNILMARTAGRLGIGFGGSVMLLFGIFFWLAPHWVIGLFLDLDDPAFAEIVVLAAKLLAIAAWFEFFDGTQTIAMGAIHLPHGCWVFMLTAVRRVSGGGWRWACSARPWR
ncbi:multidrug efflux protein NorA, partial [Pseudomonas syringae pv. actinidiae ICMP 19070]